jgi:hypothetical protein
MMVTRAPLRPSSGLLVIVVVLLAAVDGLAAWLADQTVPSWIALLLAAMGGSYQAWAFTAILVGWFSGTIARGARAGVAVLVGATAAYYLAIVVSSSRTVGFQSLGQAAALYVAVAVPAGLVCGGLGAALRVARGRTATLLGAASAGLLLADAALAFVSYVRDPNSPPVLIGYPWESLIPVVVVIALAFAMRRQLNATGAVLLGVPVALLVGSCLSFAMHP